MINNYILILEVTPVNQEFFSVHSNKIFVSFRTTNSIHHVLLNFQKMSALDFCQISGACFYKVVLITVGMYFPKIRLFIQLMSFISSWRCTASLFAFETKHLGSSENYVQNSKGCFHRGFANYPINDQCWLNVEGNICNQWVESLQCDC